MRKSRLPRDAMHALSEVARRGGPLVRACIPAPSRRLNVVAGRAVGQNAHMVHNRNSLRLYPSARKRKKVHAMRVLLKASFNTEKTNDLIRSGKMPQLLQETLERVKPEAAYFTTDHGERTAYLIFDMEDSSQMPVIGEPFFIEGNAEVDYTPVMNWEDLQRGLSQLK